MALNSSLPIFYHIENVCVFTRITVFGIMTGRYHLRGVHAGA